VLHPKKVGALPVEGREELKQTNEIGMFTKVLDEIDIAGKDITADALLNQRKLATYVVERKAHYHFTAKGNQPTLQSDITLLFQNRGVPDHAEVTPPDHGRIETRRIWCSSALNDYLDFPHVGQVFMIEREVFHKKSGKTTFESVAGLTSRPPEQADPKRVLAINRGHWAVESHHYMLDWNFNEDRSRIRTGHGPENVTRLRRFAIGILKGYGNAKTSISEKMRSLNRNTRLVFDYLRMTKNSNGTSATVPG
jgi:predicted transposase YbfD/YdcC